MPELTLKTEIPIAPPHGLNELIATFGNIVAYIREDPTHRPAWAIEQLVTTELPVPLALSWDRSRQVGRITCHRLLQPTFEAAFQAVDKAGLRSKLSSFGGCFAFRPQRTGTKLSTHSWGIAVD